MDYNGIKFGTKVKKERRGFKKVHQHKKWLPNQTETVECCVVFLLKNALCGRFERYKTVNDEQNAPS